MNQASNNQFSPFAELKFLWDEQRLQTMQAESADEVLEDRLGQLLYVDDYTSLPLAAQKLIDQEQQRLSLELFSLTLVRNVIGQSVIIAVDRVIKSVSQNIENAKKGPMVSSRTSFLGDIDAPHVYWAYAVRCAANYVRHAGEWKSEALTYRATSGKFPTLNDFRRSDTRSNIDALRTVLGSNIEHLIEGDCTNALADRLNLLKGEEPLDALFQAWKQAQ